MTASPRRLGLRYWTADIEANRWIDFLLVGLFTGEEYLVFTSLKRFLDYCLDKRAHGVRIYLHNGGNYDMLFFVNKFLMEGWNLDLRYIERQGRLIAVTVVGDGFKMQFADSYCLLPMKLEKLMEGFDVPHKKVPVNFDRIYRATDRKLREHLENDCRGLYEVIAQFKAVLPVEELKLTIAAQAMHIFREVYFPSTLEQMEENAELRFRDRFYHGGRVEVYKGRGSNLNYYDVNSLFPYAMRFPMPVGDFRETRREQRSQIGFYRVKLLTPYEGYVSPFLVKVPKDKKREGRKINKGNYYVQADRGDEFDLSSADLELLRELGLRYEVLEGLVFSDKEPILRKYVNDFYKMKVEAGKGSAKYVMAKFLLNAIYGKFGQSRYSYEVKDYTGQPDAEDFAMEYNLCLVPTKRRSKFILPYLAAYITSLARAHHFRFMMQAGPGGRDMYYCDTDSLITTAKFRTGSEIGELSSVGTFDEGVFVLPKSYALRKGREETVVIKGFSSNKFTFRDLLRSVSTGEKLVSRGKRLLSFRECFRYDKAEESKIKVLRDRGLLLKLVASKKIFTPYYDKRRVLRDLGERRARLFETAPYKKGEVITSEEEKRSEIAQYFT